MTQPSSALTTPAIVVSQSTINKNTTPMRIALFNEDGTPLELEGGATPDAGDILMTGYVEGEDEAILPTDTVAEAIAKLEARLVVVEGV